MPNTPSGGNPRHTKVMVQSHWGAKKGAVTKGHSRGSRKSFLRRWRVPTFWLSGWAILLVVLLSATPSGEQIRLRTVGSAFDPATAAVTVGPKKPKIEARQLISGRTDQDTGGPDFAPLLATSQAVELRRPIDFAGQQTLAWINFVAAPAKPLARPHTARAPPIA